MAISEEGRRLHLVVVDWGLARDGKEWREREEENVKGQ